MQTLARAARFLAYPPHVTCSQATLLPRVVTVLDELQQASSMLCSRLTWETQDRKVTSNYSCQNLARAIRCTYGHSSLSRTLVGLWHSRRSKMQITFSPHAVPPHLATSLIISLRN